MRKKVIRNITISAILMALGAVLKYYGIMLTPTIRISFFAVPLILAGLTCGMPYGLLASFGADLIYSMVSGYTYNFGFAISALYWGVLGGIFNIIVRRKNKLPILVIIIGIFITSILETHTNVLMSLVLYGTHTALVDLLQKYLVLVIKFPLLVIITKLIYERVIKRLGIIN